MCFMELVHDDRVLYNFSKNDFRSCYSNWHTNLLFALFVYGFITPEKHLLSRT